MAAARQREGEKVAWPVAQKRNSTAQAAFSDN
jgi:hypothetical protein